MQQALNTKTLGISQRELKVFCFAPDEEFAVDETHKEN